MSRKRKDNSPINENWIKTSTLKEWKQSAKQTLQKCKEFESQHQFIWVKSETQPRCFIRKIVN